MREGKFEQEDGVRGWQGGGEMGWDGDNLNNKGEGQGRRGGDRGEGEEEGEGGCW